MLSFIRNNLANLLTCGNLTCGGIGLVLVLQQGQLKTAAWLIVLAGVFDFLDGFVARLLKSASTIGKELDSLADMVTFGTLPAIILVVLFQQADMGPLPHWLPFYGLLVAVFSAIRLAIFNVSTNQSYGFIGMPTPANAFFVGSFAFLVQEPLFAGYVSNPWFLIALTTLSAVWLVLPVPLFAFKFKNYSLKDNWHRYFLLGLSLALVVALGYLAIPFIIITYVILSLITSGQ